MGKVIKAVLIIGGTGFIGSQLAIYLKTCGYKVSILSRMASETHPFKSFQWNPSTGFIDPEAFLNQDYIINLAGASIAKKYWTRKRKSQILQSRLESIELINKSIRALNAYPKKIIVASAIGYYGHRPKHELSENSLPGHGFLSEVCQKLENKTSILPNTVVNLRIGIVLSNKGGYWVQMQKILKSRLNIIFGNGKQKLSWIHLSDLLRIIHFILEKHNPNTVYNCTNNEPVSSLTLQKLITRTVKPKVFTLKISAFLTKILLGNFSELFLNSQEVIPMNLNNEGFVFDYPNLESLQKMICE